MKAQGLTGWSLIGQFWWCHPASLEWHGPTWGQLTLSINSPDWNWTSFIIMVTNRQKLDKKEAFCTIIYIQRGHQHCSHLPELPHSGLWAFLFTSICKWTTSLTVTARQEISIQSLLLCPYQVEFMSVTTDSNGNKMDKRIPKKFQFQKYQNCSTIHFIIFQIRHSA